MSASWPGATVTVPYSTVSYGVKGKNSELSGRGGRGGECVPYGIVGIVVIVILVVIVLQFL